MGLVKVVGSVIGVVTNENGTFYRVAYTLSEPTGTPPHLSGEALVPFDSNMTETEANAFLQERLAIHANAEASGTVDAGITVADVRGGRI